MRAALCLGLVSLLACAALAPPAPPENIHQLPWLQVETQNFSVWTNLPEDQARRMGRDLELFRAVAEFVTGIELPTSPVPTRVFAFDSYRTSSPFRKPNVLGYFTDRLRDNLMLLGGDCICVAQHEYTHFLDAHHASYVYPKWYSEGFAEFLGATRFDSTSVDIGGVPDHGPPIADTRARYQLDSWGPRVAPWSPMEEILSAGVAGTGGQDPLQMYSQSWALVHYLYFGRGSKQNTRKQLGRYFRVTQSGTSVREAVRLALGISVGELNDRVYDYVKRGRYTYVTREISEFGEFAEPAIEAVPASLVAAALGELSLVIGRYAQAQDYYEKSLALDPGSAETKSGLANAAWVQDRIEEAQRLHDEALDMAPESPIVHLEAGRFLFSRAEHAEDAEERAGLARKARSHFVKSWKLDDSIPETYALYGATHLLEGQDAKRGLATLQHALSMRPGSLQAMSLLAPLQLKAGNEAEARRLALIVYGSYHVDASEPISDVLMKTGGIPGMTEISD